MPAKRLLTVLFTPLDGWGHINACHGLAETLRDRGHRVVFAVDSAFKGRLESFGFDEELHYNTRPVVCDIDPRTDYINKNPDLYKLSAVRVAETVCVTAFERMFNTFRDRDSQYKQIIARVRPDIIVIDSYIGSPTLTNSGVPFVWLYSAAPLMAFNNDQLPPPWSGLPIKGNRKEWLDFNGQLEHMYQCLHNTINQWLLSEGAPPLESDSSTYLHPRSKHLNIYMYPKELDYQEVQPLPSNWRRVDGFVRTTDETFTIPECLRHRPGKLVLLSMGSIGCSHLELMIRLTQILAKSRHRFIVNKGPLHNRYDLPANMWGQEFLPQTAVLPLVDLVITHGGNNTVTETFYYGKPMLVLPMFSDQYENAQRLCETGLGVRISPFHCSDSELLDAVDRMVNDSQLAQTMKTIGDRIRKSNDKEVVAGLIESIVWKQN
ncbi:NDP-glycosyltransferase YjiC-like [Oppia nitens]|uniref:NDP-glycosyltransferase YjiC-like n=1 Tax=Oppia nitens TaxID=1686743 RepID=UPI0023DC67BC|nr:NDP-glycosyltransferase YjiC-like [Oppia nitens]